MRGGEGYLDKFPQQFKNVVENGLMDPYSRDERPGSCTPADPRPTTKEALFAYLDNINYNRHCINKWKESFNIQSDGSFESLIQEIKAKINEIDP
jgi:hypothetical protein